jgi:hypothetical protein
MFGRIFLMAAVQATQNVEYQKQTQQGEKNVKLQL